MSKNLLAIGFINTETNHTIYYTGKAGGDWLSPNKSDAFFAYNADGVNYLGGKMQARHDSLKSLSLVSVARDD